MIGFDIFCRRGIIPQTYFLLDHYQYQIVAPSLYNHLYMFPDPSGPPHEFRWVELMKKSPYRLTKSLLCCRKVSLRLLNSGKFQFHWLLVKLRVASWPVFYRLMEVRLPLLWDGRELAPNDSYLMVAQLI